MPLPQLVAHRGYPRHYPENTLPGIEAAVRLGARFVEFDVQLSADRVPVLHHDRTLARVCGVASAVHELTLDDLSKLRASERGYHGDRFADQRLGSLAEAVALLERHPGVTAFVDLKAVAVERFGGAEVVSRVLPAVEAIRGRAVLISHVPEALVEVRRQGGEATGLILRRWEQLADGSAEALAPDFVFCRVSRLPSRGPIATPLAPLAVYDVVDPDEARALAERGAALVETFAIGEMLDALGRPAPPNP